MSHNPSFLNIDGERLKSYLAESAPYINGLNEVISKYISEPDKNIIPTMINGKLTLAINTYECCPIASK